MDFSHTETRRMLQETLSRFLQDQYSIETRHHIAASRDGFSRENWRSFADLGLMGMAFSEADGGFGGKGFDLAVLFESLGEYLVVEPLLASCIQAGQLLSQLGNSQQKTLIDNIIAGQCLMAFGHYEPTSRYELNEIITTAQKNSQGWRLNGHKCVVLNGDSADTLILSARTSGGSNDESGISLFLVDATINGLSLQKAATIDGGRIAEVYLQEVQLEHNALLGDEGSAFSAIEQTIGASILASCAEALGVMNTAKDQMLEYLKTRKQFGRAIGNFQVLQHKMVDKLIDIEQIRSAVINAAAAFEGDRINREKTLSSAKYLIGTAGRSIAEEFIHMHGGMGMSWEMPVSHYCKRLIMLDHLFGDADYHLERYIALGAEVA